MPIQAISAQRLYQKAADQLTELIRSGEYPPGSKLPGEREFARQLGISRPTVREALIALEIAGLIEVRTGSGAFVNVRAAALPGAVRAADAGAGPFELLQARKLIEPPVAALAATTIGSAELAGLHETLALIETHTRDHWEKLAVDKLFHLRIAQATRNAVLVDVVEGLWREMHGPIFALLSERTRLTNKQYMTLADHRAIYGCIERRDPAAAHAAMLGHLVNVELTLLQGEDGSDSLP